MEEMELKMDVVTFPGMGLKFSISRIAFEIGNIVIYKYAVLIVMRNYSSD
jgi:hypothetical protein